MRLTALLRPSNVHRYFKKTKLSSQFTHNWSFYCAQIIMRRLA